MGGPAVPGSPKPGKCIDCGKSSSWRSVHGRCWKCEKKAVRERPSGNDKKTEISLQKSSPNVVKKPKLKLKIEEPIVPFKTDPKVDVRILELSDRGLKAGEIASQLNEEGLRTAKGNEWSKGDIGNRRYALKKKRTDPSPQQTETAKKEEVKNQPESESDGWSKPKSNDPSQLSVKVGDVPVDESPNSHKLISEMALMFEFHENGDIASGLRLALVVLKAEAKRG